MSRAHPPLRYFQVWLVIGWLLIASIVYVSLTELTGYSSVPHSDKAGHFFAYAVLTFWFSQLYIGRTRVRIAVGFATMGVLLEVLQSLTESRTFSLADMASNGMGVFCGWLLGSTLASGTLTRLEKLF